MMHSFPTDRFPSFSSNFADKTATCSSEMHSEGDTDSSDGTTVITKTVNDATESTLTSTAVNDSADDDVSKKRIDIFESTFPHKLYHILQNPDFKDIITWMPNGRSWKMIDRKEFTKRVLPLFFRHQKFSSFKRQLSGWEFLRGVKECSANEYHHPVRKHHLLVFSDFFLHTYIRCPFFVPLPALHERSTRAVAKDATSKAKPKYKVNLCKHRYR